ncbi:hypothetical protein [Curvivirga aplysinae]|uniref:hypothetical protein n=1 Tax=Curvivirga aplysinae TaxID=2529852 RepID=UPI0012BD6848|nr:hypothetical protein [Curvivirga aplysinae]MTI11083.1 hypothetical protein [Curvivirga aplysinae]
MFQLLKTTLRCLFESQYAEKLLKYDARIQDPKLKASDDLLQITFQDIKSRDLCSFLKEFDVNLKAVAEDLFQFHYHDVPIRYPVNDIYKNFETAQAEFTVMIQLDFIEFNRTYIEDVLLILEVYENARNVEFSFKGDDVSFFYFRGYSNDEIFSRMENKLREVQKKYEVTTLYGGLDTAVIELSGSWFIHDLEEGSNHHIQTNESLNPLNFLDSWIILTFENMSRAKALDLLEKVKPTFLSDEKIAKLHEKKFYEVLVSLKGQKKLKDFKYKFFIESFYFPDAEILDAFFTISLGEVIDIRIDFEAGDFCSLEQLTEIEKNKSKNQILVFYDDDMRNVILNSLNEMIDQLCPTRLKITSEYDWYPASTEVLIDIN